MEITPDRKFPIGPEPKGSEPFDKTLAIMRLTSLPTQLEQLIKGLSNDQLELRYREDSWTVRQVVHHLADSHINAYLRLKWGLTEDQPKIEGYNEVAWAQLPDASEAPVEPSISILKGIHFRMGLVLSELKKEDWDREYFHNERKQMFTITQWLSAYDWHGRHHLGHLRWALQK